MTNEEKTTFIAYLVDSDKSDPNGDLRRYSWTKLKPRWNLHLWHTANRSLGVPLCPCPAIEERSCHTTDLSGNAHPTLALV